MDEGGLIENGVYGSAVVLSPIPETMDFATFVLGVCFGLVHDGDGERERNGWRPTPDI